MKTRKKQKATPIKTENIYFKFQVGKHILYTKTVRSRNIYNNLQTLFKLS